MADKIVKLAELSRAITGLWTKVKAFVSNAISITSIKVNGAVQSIGSDKSVNINVPTKTSQLSNDLGFITKIVTDLVNYYTKGQIDGKISTLESLISVIPKFEIKVVKQLPTTGISKTTIYLVKQSPTQSENLFAEYIRITDEGTDKWEKLGEIKVDMTQYLKKDEAAALYLLQSVFNAKMQEITTQLQNILSNLSLKRDKADKTFQDKIQIVNEFGNWSLESVDEGLELTESQTGQKFLLSTVAGSQGTEILAFRSDIPQFSYATPAEIDSIINSLS